MNNIYYETVAKKADEAMQVNQDNITKAAILIKDSIISGGILQAFGSGHSYANAIEICGRAGGLIPSKLIDNVAMSHFEMVEGVGTQYCKTTDFRKNDVVVLVSNSGRNPLLIEMAIKVKEVGAKLIVLTSYEESKQLTSRHSSGKKLYEFADAILDNRSIDGDAIIPMDGLDVKIGGSSSIVGAYLLNETTSRAIKMMLDEGYVPPIFKSANVDGGPEFNEVLLEKYQDRLYRR